jgi:hypothetical protein
VALQQTQRIANTWLSALTVIDLSSASLAMELCDICGRIAELIDLCADADKILKETLEEAMGRAAIGLGPAPNN